MENQPSLGAYVEELERLETGSTSHRSSRSGQSRTSTSSSLAARKRAKAEASRVRAEFARREAELLKQEAVIEEERKVMEAKAERLRRECNAERNLLAEEKEAAAAEAEATVLEYNEENRGTQLASVSSSVKLNLPSQSPATRTRDYVSTHVITESTPQADPPHNSHPVNNTPERGLNINAEPFPYTRDSFSEDFNNAATVPDAQALAKFLLKKDLMMSRLTHFNEQPETFEVWRTSFLSIMRELDVTPPEELDLLVKYLGPESSKYALSLRASNPSNPQRGLCLLWQRLEERYGSPELVESCLKGKLERFPQLTYKDSRRFYELSDIVDEIQCAKENSKLKAMFSIYDSSVGVNAIICKLPPAQRQKWVTQAARYKEENRVAFPPFTFLVKFVRNLSKIQNDPAFSFDKDKRQEQDIPRNQRQVLNRKTDVKQNMRCPIHKAQHLLTECRAFATKSWRDRIALLKEANICFKCLSSTEHMANKCTAVIRCGKCGKNHHTIMHREGDSSSATPTSSRQSPPKDDGGEHLGVKTKCTSLCNGKQTSRSCGKVIKVRIFPEDQPEKSIPVYAVLDDQSNRSLATPEVMDSMGNRSEEIVYSLTSCSGTCSMSGRQFQGLCVQSLDGQKTLKLPSVIECSKIPDDRSEIPTPDVALHHPHLNRIAKDIPQLDDDVPISLLIGRDLPEAHHVLEQVLGPHHSPFAQRLPLGWVIIGDVCLNKMHKPSAVSVAKTHIMHGNRGTIFEPCPYDLKVSGTDQLGSSVFERTAKDDKIGTSVEDRQFLSLMDKHFKKNEEDRWTAPLPLRSSDPVPLNNRPQAISRAHGLHASLKKDPVKREHFFKFMSKILDSGSAEEAPALVKENSRWYLPLFGVYHPKKPDKIRGVFDSSATFEGYSLNSMMLSGPDLTNSLVGILLRFRRDEYAVTGDIEQMFYQFFVDKHHRDLLRFFWYKDNDFSKPLVEYRMCVHVFGNSPSPAVATYGLRKTVASTEEDVKNFVSRDFYIDDGVMSVPRNDQAASLMKRTQTALMENGKIRLHKFASNDREILRALPKEDLCPELQCLDLSDCSTPLPVHNCLGLLWDLDADTFKICLQLGDTTFTHRGILSALNSIYDPLGFLAPAVIAGRILLREICYKTAWDEPLPAASQQRWEQWKKSLEPLREIEVPRMILPISLSCASDVEIHIFCDASEKAIAAVAYAKVVNDPEKHIGFIMGKSKVAPQSGHTIPRLELCSAVLATDLWQMISEQLDITPKSVTFYTDSKVVLGYISNETRRFYTYVSNRVEHIRHVSHPDQWQYVPTDVNPADAATRCLVDDLDSKQRVWLQGPREVLGSTSSVHALKKTYPLVFPDTDSEVRPRVFKTKVSSSPPHSTMTSRFEKYSSWSALINSLCLLRHVCQSFHSPTDSCKNWHQCSHYRSIESLKATETFVIQAVQTDAFSQDIECISKNKRLAKTSSIISLSPFLDEEGLLRVGGRLTEVEETLGLSKVHPVILPKNHHVSTLLVRHYHQKVGHQGRHFTEGALRSAGFWIIGAKRLVASEIQGCFTCRRLRGKQASQQMASLPVDRVLPSAPFSHVGLDVFGSWSVVTRKTRGGQSSAKRWAVIFTCMATRAIHIEILEDMSSSSFVNGLRRFLALRGPVTELRSD